MHPRTPLLLVLVTALLAGCPPPSYGIFRWATIETAPDLACVRGILESSGVTSIEFYDYTGGRRVTWRGLAAPSHSPSFISTASGLRYALQVHIDPGLSVVLSHVGFAERDTPEEECRGRNCSGA